jgi:GT2 family glycosyltransferase
LTRTEPPGHAPNVRVVVLNYEGGDLTRRCVDALLEADAGGADVEVVVVDNGSHDGVADWADRRDERVRVIRAGSNLGFAGGCNLAMRDLTGVDFVALVNNDAVVDSGWLAPLLEALSADPGAGAAASKILYAAKHLEVGLLSPTRRRGRVDGRALGVALSGVRVDGVEVGAAAPFVAGSWGVEPGDGTGGVVRWTDGAGRLRLPVPPSSDGGPRTVPVELRVSAVDPCALRVALPDGTEQRVDVDARPRWATFDVTGTPFPVIINAGSIITDDGHGADRGWLEPDDGRYDEPCEVFAWCGAAVLLRAGYLRDVGLFDERLFLYYEDLELSWRGRDRWRYRYVPASVVHHDHSATAVEGSALAVHQNERNRLLVLTRHASAKLALLAWPRHLAATASYAKRDVVAPLLRGERPRPRLVVWRLRAFVAALVRAPGMLRSRVRR